MPILEQLIGTQVGLVIAFLATAGVVVLAGMKLSVYGDALGTRTGLSGGLVGLFFLAAVTSLPELVVSLTSVLKNADPALGADLATGNMLGSNIFNLLILAFMVLIFPRLFIPQQLKSDHTQSILDGLTLLVIFSVAFLFARILPGILPLLRCHWAVLLLPAAYIFFLIREHRSSKSEVPVADNQLPSKQKLTHQPAIYFYSILMLLCGLVVGGGIVLSLLGSQMALPPEQGGFGMEASLIGTLFLAVSTSLPELVVSFTCVRIGLPDMAVGNVLGSNMFNLLIIFASDIAMRGHSLLEKASSRHWISVGMIFALTLLAAVLLRTKNKRITVALAVLMIVLYLSMLPLFG